ncbi:hypothetical protein SAMN04489867_2315 [Pedococcus dokdonensis]|uniref:DUF2231 domain-containing protein n=1 Tax=Pedococcus dokdonensis TaxID=443156 RepID=A0A1H0SDI6_9MICO|nr:DUF2231 domain-containing protein [Pedococcus dokdonensis]SDP39794.1 hypothetical protein SAMN04489867_2315 [Pedococcus dokdonensis]
MEINGLPAHALLVHLVVVLLPLTAVAAIVVSAWPAAQRKLTFLVPVGAVIGAIAVPITTSAGEDLAKKLGNPPFLEKHENFGDMVLPWAAALAVTTIAQWLYLRRDAVSTVPRIVLAVLVVAAAVGTATIVALTGDSGAQAVWGNS